MKIQRSHELDAREHFGLLCNVRGLMFGAAVEIGTDRGAFAAAFLRCWRGPQLYCVDPWEPYLEMTSPRQADYLMTVTLLAPYADRVRILCMPSLKAAKRHLGGAVVFVYIDGLHTTKAVGDDCLAWWPRLVANGILAGHDIQKPRVREAVELFAGHVGRTVWTTGARTGSPSWYIYRDQATEPFGFEVSGWLGRAQLI